MGSNKLNVLVGSKNPTKIKAVSEAFKRVFKKNNVVVSGVSVPSGVSDQPMGSNETKTGAENRLKNLKTHLADFYVGIEGGCSYQDKILYAFAWVVVENKKGRQGRGKTSMFQLPKKIKDLIEGGVELGVADDIVFNRKNSKKKDGAIGILTGGLIDRTKYYEEAVVLSLIPFLNKKLFSWIEIPTTTLVLRFFLC